MQSKLEVDVQEAIIQEKIMNKVKLLTQCTYNKTCNKQPPPWTVNLCYMANIFDTKVFLHKKTSTGQSTCLTSGNSQQNWPYAATLKYFNHYLYSKKTRTASYYNAISTKLIKIIKKTICVSSCLFISSM